MGKKYTGFWSGTITTVSIATFAILLDHIGGYGLIITWALLVGVWCWSVKKYKQRKRRKMVEHEQYILDMIR